MNDRAIEWVERLPRRWARNTIIVSAPIWLFLILFGSGYVPGNASWSEIVAAVLILTVIALSLIPLPWTLLAYATGMAARRRLRTLRNTPDEGAYKAVAWLPLRYLIWGAGIGSMILLEDILASSLRGYLTSLQLWNPGFLSRAVAFLAPVTQFAVLAAIIGFIAQVALRRRLRHGAGILPGHLNEPATLMQVHEGRDILGLSLIVLLVLLIGIAVDVWGTAAGIKIISASVRLDLLFPLLITSAIGIFLGIAELIHKGSDRLIAIYGIAAGTIAGTIAISLIALLLLLPRAGGPSSAGIGQQLGAASHQTCGLLRSGKVVSCWGCVPTQIPITLANLLCRLSDLSKGSK